jgi:hypothetical protein
MDDTDFTWDVTSRTPSFEKNEVVDRSVRWSDRTLFNEDISPTQTEHDAFVQGAPGIIKGRLGSQAKLDILDVSSSIFGDTKARPSMKADSLYFDDSSNPFRLYRPGYKRAQNSQDAPKDSGKLDRQESIEADTWLPSKNFQSLTIQTGRLRRLLNHVEDPRAKSLEDNINHELFNICSWAQQRNVGTFVQLRHLAEELPKATGNSIKIACDVLDRCIDGFDGSLGRLLESSFSAELISQTDRLKIMVEGYELLGNLRFVSGVLQNDGTPFIHRKSLHSTSKLPDMNFKPPSYIHELPGETANLQNSNDKNPARAIPSIVESSIQPPISDKAQSSEPQIKTESTIFQQRIPESSELQNLFLNCVNAIHVAIGQVTKKQDLRRGQARFTVWGCGLFDGELNLSDILNGESEGVKDLRDNTFGTLADIAITLGKLALRLKNFFS